MLTLKKRSLINFLKCHLLKNQRDDIHSTNVCDIYNIPDSVLSTEDTNIKGLKRNQAISTLGTCIDGGSPGAPVHNRNT